MRLHIPDSLVRQILVGEVLDSDQIRCITRLAYLTAELDFEADADERAVLGGVCEVLCRVSGVPAQPIVPVSPLPLDDEERDARVREQASELMTRASRELAYAMAYLLAVTDAELGPLEGRFLERLRQELAISDERAADLAATAAESVTPADS